MARISVGSLAKESRKGSMTFHYGTQIVKSGFKQVGIAGHNDYGSRTFDQMSGTIRPVSSIHSEQCAGKQLVSHLTRKGSSKKRWCLLRHSTEG